MELYVVYSIRPEAECNATCECKQMVPMLSLSFLWAVFTHTHTHNPIRIQGYLKFTYIFSLPTFGDKFLAHRIGGGKKVDFTTYFFFITQTHKFFIKFSFRRFVLSSVLTLLQQTKNNSRHTFMMLGLAFDAMSVIISNVVVIVLFLPVAVCHRAESDKTTTAVICIT